MALKTLYIPWYEDITDEAKQEYDIIVLVVTERYCDKYYVCYTRNDTIKTQVAEYAQKQILQSEFGGISYPLAYCWDLYHN